ncbi:MAG TPA: hypothetical protein VFQ61_29080, partial [Polyangiaceae bacterium]|nr:hypothetical protein [Polyangiaceae bacterium]
MQRSALQSSEKNSGTFAISAHSPGAADHSPSEGSTLPSEDCEANLLTGLLADREQAWREFNSRYSRLILSCIGRVTTRFGYSSQDDVREIYATLCLQLLSHDKRKLRSFEPGRGT